MEKNEVFPGLELKTTEKEQISEQILGGVQIFDTNDYYEEICTRYPEIPASKVIERINLVGDHYKGKHAANQGKAIAYIVFTHM